DRGTLPPTQQINKQRLLGPGPGGFWRWLAPRLGCWRRLLCWRMSAPRGSLARTPNGRPPLGFHSDRFSACVGDDKHQALARGCLAPDSRIARGGLLGDQL